MPPNRVRKPRNHRAHNHFFVSLHNHRSRLSFLRHRSLHLRFALLTFSATGTVVCDGTENQNVPIQHTITYSRGNHEKASCEIIGSVQMRLESMEVFDRQLSVIAAHSHHRHTRPHHLLVSYEHPDDEVKYVSFADDETLFQQRSVPNSHLYLKENRLKNIVGISHGLVCLYCRDTVRTVIWNPSIRKSIVVDVPNYSFAGFGVCPVTTDPKIVAVTQSWDESNIETSYECKVMVYTLSSGNWRSLSTNLPTQPVRLWCPPVATNGFIYWHGGLAGHIMIIAFDVTNETFQMIDLPTTLARQGLLSLHILKLKESLPILQYEYDRNKIITVWKMEGGIQRSFTKLFTLQVPFHAPIVGFTKSGVPILQVKNDGNYKLVVYELNSEHNNVSEISGGSRFITANSYMETLLLLGRSDSSSY